MRPTLALLAALLTGALTGAHLTGCSGGERDGLTLLHVSYDPTRELFTELNAGFAEAWAHDHGGQRVAIRMSHGGSGRQARAVIDGLEADVVSLAIPYDIDAIAREGQLVDGAWSGRLPDRSSPWASTIVFVVRRGNPRGVRDWPDLLRGETRVIAPSPRTSGGARYAYLAAYGHALRHGYDGQTGEAAGTAFVRELYRRIPVLDSGARGSSTTFARNGIGDVLLTWENEAHLLLAEHAHDGLEIVVPPESILAEPPVAWIDRNVERRATREVSEAYLRYLWSPAAQTVAARHHYRPRDASVPSSFPSIQLFTVDEVFGGWERAHAEHFAEGARFDRIYQPGAPR